MSPEPVPLPSRCPWAESSAAMRSYHDEEWGVPSHDDRHLFEMLILEGAQAGLSWSTVLAKRANYRLAFDGFYPDRVASFDEERLETLLGNPGIIRHRLKLRSAVTNARAFLAVQAECGSFADYLWAGTGDEPIVNRPRSMAEMPSRSEHSDAMSKDLKRRGFSFVGTTIVYAFFQAVGVVNDHLVDCPAKYPPKSNLGQSKGGDGC